MLWALIVAANGLGALLRLEHVGRVLIGRCQPGVILVAGVVVLAIRELGKRVRALAIDLRVAVASIGNGQIGEGYVSR